MKKMLLLCLTLIFLVISPVCVMADTTPTTDDKTDSIEELGFQTSPFQWTITDLNLAVGDFINNMITEIVGQKITIQSLIFNEVEAVNANFFSSGTGGNSSVHKTVKTQVNKWYAVFETLAIDVYLAGLLAIGIKMVLSESTLSRAGAKDIAKQWITGLLILFMFKFIMQYAFEINEDFVGAIKKQFALGQHVTGTYIGDDTEYSKTSFEFRSPEYRSKYSGILSFGGEALNQEYVRRLGDYRSSADMMRIMRAYAGISHRIIFCIIWFVLLFQLIIMLVKYYKRYFVLAFLITVFPLVTIAYLIDAVKGRQCQAFRAWCTEFFVNVFTQSVHAIIYAIIASVCIKQVQNEMAESANMNWIIIIVAINFLFQGEKIVRKVLGADGANSDRGIGESAKAGRGGMARARQNFKKIGGMFRGRD